MPTLAVMRADVLREADSSGLIDDADVNVLVNDAASELFDLLTQSFEDYSITSSDLTITAGTSSVALPATFFKGRGVDDLEDTNNPRELPRFGWQDRNRRGRKSYAIIGSNLQIRPTENAPGTYRLHFVPLYTDLSADGDTFTAPNRWEQYITHVAAARLREIQDLDSSQQVARAERIRKRIEEAAKQRDAGNPGKARDVKWRRRFGSQTEFADWEEW